MKNLTSIIFNKLNLSHFWWKLILLFFLVSSSLHASGEGAVYVYLIILPMVGISFIFLLLTIFFMIYNIVQKNFQRKITALIFLIINSIILSIILLIAMDNSVYGDEFWIVFFMPSLLSYSINTYYYLKCIDFSKNTTITKKGIAIAIFIPFLFLSIVRCRNSFINGASTEEKYSIVYHDTSKIFTTKSNILALPLYIITDTISLPITGTVTLYRHYKFSKVNKIFQPVKENNTSKMADLISKGTNINFTNSSNETLLVKAIILNHFDMVRFLLDQGADINLDAGSGTPLYHSLELEDHKIFDLLLERNVDYNLKTVNSELAIIRAIKLNKEYCTKELLKKYKDINSIKDNEENLLMIALQNGPDANSNIIRILLEQGIDLESKDSNGNDALSIASANGSVETVKLLLSKGANPNKPNSEGETPIFNAINSQNIEMINLLLDNKADINKQNNSGETALMRSVSTSYGEKNIVDLLIKRGVDKNLKNKEGKTAQQLAIELDYNDIAELLK